MTLDQDLFSLEIKTPPPSANSLYANARGKGRVKAKAYADWRKAAAWAARLARRTPRPIGGAVVADIEVGLGSRHRFDLDNRIKAVLDALVDGGVVEDDSQIAAIHARKSGTPGVRVRLYPDSRNPL